MPFIKSHDGTQLFFNDWGQGRPVVLIHGWPHSSVMWESQVLALRQAGHRVIAYDRRGFGKSDQPWDGYEYDTMAADLAALLDVLDVREAALVGFSMGGGEVLRYLSRHGGSGRINQAVLVGAVTPGLLQREDNPKGVPASVFQDIKKGLTDDRAKFLKGFFKDFYGVGFVSSPVSDEKLAWDVSVALQASLKATLDCVDAFGATDFRADVPALGRVQTLVIHGVDDKTVPIDVTARRLKQLAPQVGLIEYEGEAHGLFATAKERLNRDLVQFLGAVQMAPR